MRKLLFLAIGLLFMTPSNFAQSTDAYGAQWETADSLLEKGLPKSARKEAESILKSAQSKNNIPNILKAQLFLLNASSDSMEDFYLQAVAKAEKYIQNSDGVQKAIWQCITANYYWEYYQSHRYEILGRNPVSGNPAKDFTTWDANRFMGKISELYRQALLPAAQLRQVAADDFAPLLIPGTNTEFLHPTMFDVLAYTSLDFFQNKESGLPQPENSFELSDRKGLLPVEQFVHADFSSLDSNAQSLQAVKIYQQLLAFHLQQKNNDEGLMYADLQRLAFVYHNSVASDKDSLYFQALNNLAAAFPKVKTTAEARFQMASFLYQPDHYPIVLKNNSGAIVEKKTRDLPEIRRQLLAVIAEYPGSQGAVHAQNLINAIDAKDLDVQVEEAYLPHKPIKALLRYKNRNKVYLSLYRYEHAFQRSRENYGGHPAFDDLLESSRPVEEWSLSPKGTEDLEQHSTEFKINALPSGNYFIVVSGKQKIEDDDTDNNVVFAPFQVSGLSVVANNDVSGSKAGFWLLSRMDGQPVAGAEIRFWKYEYQQRKRKYELKLAGSTTSDEMGKFDQPGKESNLKISIASKDDTLLVNDYFYNHEGAANPARRPYTFFFTDRSIYRPGQTVYFKGIMLEHENGTAESHVLENQSSVVTFLDANGQKITSIEVKTNEFGSFSGTFKAPENRLTGIMRIQNESGGTSFSVEEYKRPKFYVAFDTLKGDFALNKPVTIKGFAKAYAGNNIEGATVQYHVTRRARFPYFWAFYRWGQPSAPQKEITHGLTKTNADGSFTIEFTALPDKSIDPKTLPVFSYEISVDVTDVNGEARSGAQTVQAGYRSMQIIADVPEQGFAKDFDTIGMATQNLNGVFIPATLQLVIQKLQFPGKIYRERLWPKPDEQLLSEAAFHQEFPDDEYENESDYHYWQPGTTIFSGEIHTEQAGRLSIPENIWRNEGWYVLTFKGKDMQGWDVEQKEYAYVILPEKKKPAEQPIIALSEKAAYQPGEQAKIWLGTGFKNAHLLGVSSLKDDFNQAGWITHSVSEGDRGGMGFSWLYVYNNRVYKTSKEIAVPWNNKELEITWETHRDKLLPGAGETWNMTVKGKGKEKVAAELLAGMYDASLDAFKPHSWNWDKLLPGLNFYPVWTAFDFNVQNGTNYTRPPYPGNDAYQLVYPKLNLGIGSLARVLPDNRIYGARSFTGNLESVMVRAAAPLDAEKKSEDDLVNAALQASGSEANQEEDMPVQIRQNLQETAFFMPQLHTDKQGNITFSFTMPEALTKWKFMAFAHTKDWKTGYLEGSVRTQKELMVQPNLPRFLRQGDDLELSAKVVNLSDKALSGTASLEILNALTNQPMALTFRLQQQEQEFQAGKGRSASVNWKIHVPESVYQPVIIRIVAKAGNFSDGEDDPLPVLSDRMLVTETLPLPVKGTGKHDFTFEKLLQSDSSADAQTLANHALTVEFTGNPAWYAVLALPYLMEYPHECSEQTFSRFYANALAEHIVEQSPKVAQIFNRWRQDDTAALLSGLEKNQELKSALLEETPWVLEAKSETEQKHRIAMLFQANKMARGLENNLRKLAAVQLPDGAFSWFTGMRANRYITQYILSGMGRLQHLGVSATQNNVAKKIIRNGVRYADEAMQEDYDDLLKRKASLKAQHLDYTGVQYLYLRSFFLKDYPVPAKNKKAFDFYKNQALQYWSKFNPYLKAMLSLALNRMGEPSFAEQIVTSLKETSVHNPEMGMYWKSMPGGYYWYQSGIEAQSLIIAAFTEVGRYPDEIADMKTWLLKNKQTTNWQTTTATADAIYALLLSGGNWLAYEPGVRIDLGTKKIGLPEGKTQAGTGYFKETIPGKDIRPEMGKISITVDNPGGTKDIPVSWGTVYWQYFQDMDKIAVAESPLYLEKELFIKQNTAEGQKLTRVTDGNTLKVGDKVTVRIILRSDRDMDYVQLKDMHAAAFEPVDVLSGYHFQNGLGYYQSTLDASTDFFFDRLPKGTYVLEYSVFVGQRGVFSNGISMVQCMYAPEFSGHSKGLKITVE
ncbi:MAG TPA: alpha-2-macroglobulin family protein [Edaphocola sp.]|nr:alpha-2-macroglobulin family protein [Edaphocola sp.]